MEAALVYHEPNIVSILILSSFLLVLDVGNYVVDSYLSCGIVFQLLVGIAWGTPGVKLLDNGTENFITLLGYLGLILLVFEDGLSTNVRALRKNLVLSFAVALTGIAIPIALSFILLRLADAIPLQAFAAGAALCSTSLGTTFTVLKASSFDQTRLGSVLTSAAMLDDVVGLVMVQIISNLDGSFEPASVLRPVGVSMAFALTTVGFCLSTKYCAKVVAKMSLADRLARYQHSAFIIQSLFLIGMVTAASYAGTSNLFATYLAGVCINWWYESDVMQKPAGDPSSDEQLKIAKEATMPASSVSKVDTQTVEESRKPCSDEPNTAMVMYKEYYMPIVEGILKPFFFASIGFAIPITQMFGGAVIWRGLIYALLMVIAKMFTGLWLIRLDLGIISWLKTCTSRIRRQLQQTIHGREKLPQPSMELSCGARRSEQAVNGNLVQASIKNVNTSKTVQSTTKVSNNEKPKRPISLYPAAILGTAMVARGEIGFLIATTAQASGIFDQDGSQTLYLTVVWAVVLCTVIGPVFTGLLAKRVKRLQKVERNAMANECEDPLGPWDCFD